MQSSASSVMHEPTVRYAAYGSNLHIARLAARTPSARRLGAGVLDGHTLAFHKRGRDGSGKCSIAAADDTVHVAVFELDPADKPVLDRVEGVGAGYRDVLIEVPHFGACFTYVAEASHVDDSLRPFCWYKRLVVLGCRYNGFPDDYTRRVARHLDTGDPDTARHREHMQLVRRIEAGLPFQGAEGFGR